MHPCPRTILSVAALLMLWLQVHTTELACHHRQSRHRSGIQSTLPGAPVLLVAEWHTVACAGAEAAARGRLDLQVRRRGQRRPGASAEVCTRHRLPVRLRPLPPVTAGTNSVAVAADAIPCTRPHAPGDVRGCCQIFHLPCHASHSSVVCPPRGTGAPHDGTPVCVAQSCILDRQRQHNLRPADHLDPLDCFSRSGCYTM